MNFTIKPFIKNTWNLTNNCIDWCREQHFINDNNLQAEGLIIPALAFLLLVFHIAIINHSEFIIQKTDFSENQLERICKLASQGAAYLLIGFFVWYFWFR